MSKQTAQQDYDWLVKVIILGDSGVGKTNILSRFCDEKFTMTHMATIGVDFKIKTIVVDGKRIKLQIWDTAGQERFRNITKTYYKGAYGIGKVLKMLKRGYEQGIQLILNSYNQSIKENTQDEATQILIGNKSDMVAERQVDTSEGKQLADQYNIPFLETSAKDNINISDIFQKLGVGIKERLLKEELEDNKNTQEVRQIHKTPQTNKKEGKQCC